MRTWWQWARASSFLTYRLHVFRSSRATTISAGSVHSFDRNAIVLPTAPGRSGASTNNLTMTWSPSTQLSMYAAQGRLQRLLDEVGDVSFGVVEHGLGDGPGPAC